VRYESDHCPESLLKLKASCGRRARWLAVRPQQLDSRVVACIGPAAAASGVQARWRLLNAATPAAAAGPSRSCSAQAARRPLVQARRSSLPSNARCGTLQLALVQARRISNSAQQLNVSTPMTRPGMPCHRMRSSVYSRYASNLCSPQHLTLPARRSDIDMMICVGVHMRRLLIMNQTSRAAPRVDCELCLPSLGVMRRVRSPIQVVYTRRCRRRACSLIKDVAVAKYPFTEKSSSIRSRVRSEFKRSCRKTQIWRDSKALTCATCRQAASSNRAMSAVVCAQCTWRGGMVQVMATLSCPGVQSTGGRVEEFRPPDGARGSAPWDKQRST